MPDIFIGRTAIATRLIDSADFAAFSALSGDNNPIHTDDQYARTTVFKNRIAPGFLIGSYISALIANELPGPGSIYMSQSLKFCRPVFAGDLIEVKLEVIEILRPGVCRLSTICSKPDSMPVIEGEALVKFPIDRTQP